MKENKINFGGKRMSVFQHHENISLALKAMQKIGCVVVGIDSHTLQSSQGKKWLVLGLLWQIIKKILLKNISVEKSNSKTQESELLNWVNLVLEKVIIFGSDKRQGNANLHSFVRWFVGSSSPSLSGALIFVFFAQIHFKSTQRALREQSDCVIPLHWSLKYLILFY